MDRLVFFLALLTLSALSCGRDQDGDVPWELRDELLCAPGASPRACFKGGEQLAGVGLCRRGTQRCLSGLWSECEGSVEAAEEVCNGEDDDCDGQIDEEVALACGLCPDQVTSEERCGDGLDNDCDGQIDETCACQGSEAPCYPGLPSTRAQGACSDGLQRCEGGVVLGGCEGAVVPTSEVCGNQIDDDCDGRVDEGCPTCIGTRRLDNQTVWQIHEGFAPSCWAHTYERNGDPLAYLTARIPAVFSTGWEPMEEERISFDERSTLCRGVSVLDALCECRRGGDFTYFQTFLVLDETTHVDSFVLDISEVDDGARITIFNELYPEGVVDDQGYAYYPSGVSVDLSRYLAPGMNRVVLTHVDDCCNLRVLRGVRVLLDGTELVECD